MRKFVRKNEESYAKKSGKLRGKMRKVVRKNEESCEVDEESRDEKCGKL